MINTAEGAESSRDGLSLRQTALARSIPYYPTMPGARAAATAMCQQQTALTAKPIQAYFG